MSETKAVLDKKVWLDPGEDIPFDGTPAGNTAAQQKLRGHDVLDHDEFMRRGVSWGSLLWICGAFVAALAVILGVVWSEIQDNERRIFQEGEGVASAKQATGTAEREITQLNAELTGATAATKELEARLRSIERLVDRCDCERSGEVTPVAK